MLVLALLFTAVAGVVIRFIWRGISSGKVQAGRQGSPLFWVVRRDDPISFWGIILVMAFLAVGALAVSWIPIFK